MSKSRWREGVNRGSTRGDDELANAKRGGVTLLVDDFPDQRLAAATGASRAAGAGDLPARLGTGSHDFAHGLLGNTFALADEHLVSLQPVFRV